MDVTKAGVASRGTGCRCHIHGFVEMLVDESVRSSQGDSVIDTEIDLLRQPCLERQTNCLSQLHLMGHGQNSIRL